MPAPVCVVQVYGADQQDANLDKAAIIISCILGAVMVLAFSFISLLVLFGNLVSRRPLDGFWYGQLLSSSLHVSMFMLLTALVLTSFNGPIDRSTANGTFPGDWSAIYKCTFALAYSLVASYLVLFFLFWLCKSAFVDYSTTTVIVESRNPSATGAAAAAAADANATVAVITKQDIKNAKRAAKAAQKVADFNKKFGGQAEPIV
ncbi:hypothetical protein ABBQ38_010697 [Trebouxia sp. C0009 RCD-2024]